MCGGIQAGQAHSHLSIGNGTCANRHRAGFESDRTRWCDAVDRVHIRSQCHTLTIGNAGSRQIERDSWCQFIHRQSRRSTRRCPARIREDSAVFVAVHRDRKVRQIQRRSGCAIHIAPIVAVGADLPLHRRRRTTGGGGEAGAAADRTALIRWLRANHRRRTSRNRQ